MANKISDNYLKSINEFIMDAARVQRQNFSDENKMLSIYLHDPYMQPRKCADIFNEKYGLLENGTQNTGDRIIHSFCIMKLMPMHKRELIIKECIKAAKLIIEALQNDTDIDNQFNKLIEGNGHKRRIVLMAMFEFDPQLQALECRETVFKLNKSFSADCIDAILALLDKDTKITNIKPEEYEAEIIRLNNSLNRANRMIERLQSEYDEKIEESKIRNQIEFIQKLNSSQYGHILDMLVASQNGFKKLRRDNYSLPVEVSAVPVLIRKIVQFVEDCGIEPIADIGDELEITTADLERYEYSGSPFENDSSVKNVVVVTTGWKDYDNEITLSNPKVKEKESL